MRTSHNTSDSKQNKYIRQKQPILYTVPQTKTLTLLKCKCILTKCHLTNFLSCHYHTEECILHEHSPITLLNNNFATLANSAQLYIILLLSPGYSLSCLPSSCNFWETSGFPLFVTSDICSEWGILLNEEAVCFWFADPAHNNTTLDVMAVYELSCQLQCRL
jgi:hypothetical protein